MRSNERITATLLVAALAGFGCSKSDEALQTKVQPQQPAQATQISLINKTTVPDKGLDFTTKPAGPVSFADGETAYKAGKYSEATKIFEQYTIDKPNNAWGHFMLGLSTWKGGDLEKSEKSFNEALRIDPNHFKSLVNLSRVLIEQKRYDEALDKLTLAGEIDSNSADVPRLFGRTYEAQGKVDDAIKAYRRAIDLDSKDAWSMNNLGLLLMSQGHHSDAVPLLSKAVELRKDVAMFHNNLGMALEHSGKFVAAAGEYRGAVEADPAYDKAKQNLTRVEAVKTGSEEPFDREATAKSLDEKKTENSSEKTTANQ